MTFTSKSPDAIAHVIKGDVLLGNLRDDEALAEFSAALKLDPGFIYAQVEHGVATPGPAGLEEIERAAAVAKDLPEPERVLIEAALLARRGDTVGAIGPLRRLTEIAPGYSRGHQLLGNFLLLQDNYPDGLAALKRATQLDPNNGAALNSLGYAALQQGDAEGAVAAFNDYVRILPHEPNAHDSLGEALLAAGRFKEAEAAFQQALTLSPQFWNGHQGVAMVRFYAGDFAGARDAWARAKTSATRPGDKMDVDADMAAAAVARGNTTEALRLLEAAAKTDGAARAQVAANGVLQAQTYIVAGHGRKALAVIDVVMKAVQSGQLPPGPTRNVGRNGLRARVAAQAQLKDLAGVRETSAALDKDAASNVNEVRAQDAMHFGRGELAAASGDFAGARSHFDQCSRNDQWCKWHGLMAAEKAGDKAGAATAREALLRLYARTQVHMIVRSRLTKTGS
jgi:tetratricopeptide (TPR) repeat protein